jgi:hypothetical protein
VIKQSAKLPRSAPGRPRNRWSSPRQFELIDSLWRTVLRQTRRPHVPARSLQEQMSLITEIVGRSIASPRELSWREANCVIRRLLDEVRASNVASRPTDRLKSEPTPPERKSEPSTDEPTAKAPKQSLAQKRKRAAAVAVTPSGPGNRIGNGGVAEGRRAQS